MDARLQGAQFKGGAKATNARNGFTVTGPDQGDGKQVFTLLRKYLREDAPDEYILHTVLRLMDLAKERRFKAHRVTMGEGQLPPEVELDIRTQWKDEPTQTQNERYKGLLSYWDCRNAEHVRRMHKLMAEWVLADNLPQGELEVRTQQFTFVNVPRQEDKEPHNEEHRTYKEAVDSGPRRPINWMEDKPELQQLYELCMQPAAVLTQLRQRTTEEYRALLMILNHELEVLFPPRFLVQTMAAKEMARFTDIFMNLEYPLYAHLAPGQRFGVSMSKDAIMAEIHMGEEEAYPQRQEIEEFKAAVARLVINMDTRILTATFKGRKSAQRWVNWRVPLGMRMLTLIDYEKEREEAKVTHELVKMDCYSFTITLRKGDLTSSDVHWLMTEKIGLQVQTLAHPEMNTVGLNDKQWVVTIIAEGCPDTLRSVDLIRVSTVELVLHQHEVHVNWPCKACHAPDHPTKYCKEDRENLGNLQTKHTVVADNRLPSSTVSRHNTYLDVNRPWTMERLTVELGDKGAWKNSTTIRGVVRMQVSKKPQLCPCLSARTHTGRMPTLPEEWNQQCTNHSAARATAEEQEDRTVVSAKDSLADRMETLASTRTHNQGNQCTTELRREDGEDRTAWRTEGTIDAEMTEATVNYYVQQQHVPEQPAETRTRTSTLISRQGKERHETEERGRSRTPSGVHPRQFGATAESERRAVSTSPKRKIPTEWEDITIHKQQLHGARNAKTPRRQGVARSVSPRRAMKSTRRGRGCNAMQKYMHQFLKRSQSTNVTLDTQSSNKSETGEQYRATDTATPSPEGVTSSQECEIVGVVPPNDLGLPVEDWLTVLGGELTDVAATGQCGWLAFYAVLRNKKTGLSPPSDETTKEANALKRQILNGMIANLADEAVMHPMDTFAEMEARRIQRAGALMTAEQICKLANQTSKCDRNRLDRASLPAFGSEQLS